MENEQSVKYITVAEAVKEVPFEVLQEIIDVYRDVAKAEPAGKWTEGTLCDIEKNLRKLEEAIYALQMDNPVK